MSFFDNLKTYNDSHERAFEALNNQLFERYVRNEFSKDLKYFTTVNGAGGDGGVEAYAILKKKIIGVQSKWFRTSLTSKQINQIKDSIITAKSVRSKLKQYIICLPRDFQSSKMGKGGKTVTNTEESKIENLKHEIKTLYPDLQLIFWNEHKIREQLQKAGNEGIRRFWFDKEELSIENLKQRFDLAKSGWLKERYIPEIHTKGIIEKQIQQLLITEQYRDSLLLKINKLIVNIDNTIDLIKEFTILLEDENKLKQPLLKVDSSLNNYLDEFNRLAKAISESDWSYEVSKLPEINCYTLIETIRKSQLPNTFKSIRIRLTNSLKYLSDINLKKKIAEFLDDYSHHNLVIHGRAGTGKTHGVANAVQSRLDQNLPGLIIRAKGTPNNSWASILQNYLGGTSWTDTEIFSGLEALSHRSDQSRLKGLSNNDILEPTQVIICIDGIDEDNNNDVWKDRINEASKIIRNFPRIKFVFTIRSTSSYNTNPCSLDFNSELRVINLPIEGDVNVNELATLYLNEYGIKYHETPWIKDSFENAFTLKLFCEKYKGVDLSKINKPISSSIIHLLNSKIQQIENEFLNKHNPEWSSNDAVMRRSLQFVTDYLVRNNFVNHDTLCENLVDNLKGVITRPQAALLLDALTAHAIIYKNEVKENDFLPPIIEYSSSYQSYADYFYALTAQRDIITSGNKSVPEVIKDWNTLKLTSTLLLNENHILVGEDDYWVDHLDAEEITKLQFVTLSSSTDEVVEKYLPNIKVRFFESASMRNFIISEFIIPNLYRKKLNLGLNFLHDSLINFPNTYERDKVWSTNEGFKNGESSKMDIGSLLEYQKLHEHHLHNELPIVLAWSLSSTNNTYREYAKNELAVWGSRNPLELIKLLDLLFFIGDPQIQEDLSIVCLGVASSLKTSGQGMKEIAQWINKNIFHPKKIKSIHNVIVRYCMRASIERTFMFGECSQDDWNAARPPYTTSRALLQLNVLKGDFFQSGRHPIVHDLVWYVIKDSYNDFFTYEYTYKPEIPERDLFLKKYERKYKEKLTPFDFGLSAGIAYIQKLGFNETTGFGMTQATHGRKSKIASIGEKYTWNAVHEIKGFLADRLPYENDGEIIERLDDYSSIISIQNPIKNFEGDLVLKPFKDVWFIPEDISPIFEYEEHNLFQDMSNWIIQDLDANVELWINSSNMKLTGSDHNDQKEWLTLYMDTDISEPNNYGRTALEIKCCLVHDDEFSLFKDYCITLDRLNQWGFSHDFAARPDSDIYSSVKDVVWMNWLKERGSLTEIEIDEYQYFNIFSGITEILENTIEDDESYFKIPSKLLRHSLEIVDTDKTRFFNTKKEIIAIYDKHGQPYDDGQERLVVDKEKFYEVINNENLKPFWIVFQHRTTTLKFRKEHNNFHAERNIHWIVWIENDVVHKIPFKENYINNQTQE